MSDMDTSGIGGDLIAAKSCLRCGQVLAASDQFCKLCGAKVETVPTRTSSALQSKFASRGIGAGLVAIALAIGVGAPLTAYFLTLDRTVDAPNNSDGETFSFADVFEREKSGVARIDVISCVDGGLGSGFLIDEQHVVTAAHVIEEAVTIGVTLGDDPQSAETVGVDFVSDLALLRLSEPSTGIPFSFAESDPRVGDPVAALGYPLDFPLTFTQGYVSGLDREIGLHRGLLQTDTPINPGNSGGPVIDRQGDVVGIVLSVRPESQGIGYALQASEAESSIQLWMDSPERNQPPECDAPRGPDIGPFADDPPDDIAKGVAETLARYFTGINMGDYRDAWNQLSPSAQARLPYPEFRAGTLSSYDYNVDIVSVVSLGDPLVLHITFTSLQVPGAGPSRDPEEPCTRWSLDYSLQSYGSRWLIESVTAHGSNSSIPC